MISRYEKYEGQGLGEESLPYEKYWDARRKFCFKPPKEISVDVAQAILPSVKDRPKLKDTIFDFLHARSRPPITQCDVVVWFALDLNRDLVGLKYVGFCPEHLK